MLFWHRRRAVTTPTKPSLLEVMSISVHRTCGLDPAKSNLFVQSHVTGHTELAWILTCITPIGELQRMTQFKDKASKLGFQISDAEVKEEIKFEHQGRAQASINAGLLCYPVLMAADILLPMLISYLLRRSKATFEPCRSSSKI